MNEQQLLEHITLNPKIMVGKPVIQGTRLTVEHILGLLAQGAPITGSASGGLTHRQGYKDVAMVTIICPLITTATVLVLGTLFGSF